MTTEEKITISKAVWEDFKPRFYAVMCAAEFFPTPTQKQIIDNTFVMHGVCVSIAIDNQGDFPKSKEES